LHASALSTVQQKLLPKKPAGRLQEKPDERVMIITGLEKHPWTVLLQQLLP
jgi:hypothetical protein